jgi:beta-fructofuranosidase
VYIKVVDNATGVWGHVNIDDVNVQVKPKGLFNHTFENSWYDLSGWTVVSGDAFSDGDVSTDYTWWGGSFNHDAPNHLWGFKEGGDGQVGVLKSENFVLSADGKIDFLIGGGNDINNLYVALVRVSDGAELFKATGSNSETYNRVTWDALHYVGTECYIKVVDNATGSWGHVNLDDVNVQIQSGTISSDTTAPTAPANLTVTEQTGNQVTLSWTASTDNVGLLNRYLINNGNTTTYTSRTATTYTRSVSSGVTYTFTVQAEDVAGNLSPVSNAVSVTIP